MEDPRFVGSPEFQEGLTSLVTSENPVVQTYGRFLATVIPDEIQNWVRSEVDRDTDPFDILTALLLVFVQTYGSVAGQTYKPSGDAALMEMWTDMGRHIPEIANSARRIRGLDTEEANG